MESLYKKLAAILEIEEVTSSAVLRDFDTWDSLTVLSVLVMLDKDYGINIDGVALEKLETVADLASFIQSKVRK
jgi:acyl carrier protein